MATEKYSCIPLTGEKISFFAVDAPRFETKIFSDDRLPVTLQGNYLYKDETVEAHWHDSVELLHYRKGCIEAQKNDQRFLATAGHVLVMHTGDVHSFKGIAEYSQCHCFIIDRRWLESFGIPLLKLDFGGLLEDERLCRQFDRIKAIAAADSTYARLELHIALLQLVRLLLEHATPRDSTAVSRSSQVAMVQRAVEYIHVHLCEPFTIEDICTHLNFSKTHLCRVYREVTGKTIVQTAQQLRCLLAERKLLGGGYTVADCARECGFPNLSYFTRTYKAVVGCLPSETLKKSSRCPEVSTDFLLT